MGTSSSSFDLRIYWDIVWRRKWIALATFVVSTMIGLYVALSLKPKYEVSSTVLLRDINLEIETGRNVLGPRVSATDNLDLLKTKILSPGVLAELIDKVGMLNDSTTTAEAKEIRASFPKLSLDEVKRGLLIDKLKEKILSIRISGNNMIEIKAEHQDPELAYNLVRTLMDIFIEQTQQAEMSGLQSGLKYSNEQLEIYKKRLDEAEARLQNLKAGRALNKFEKQQIDDQQAENLRTISLTTANQLELEQRILQEATNNLSGSDASSSSISSPAINSLLSQQLAKLNDFVALLKTSDANDERIFQINKEIKDIDTALQNEVEAITPKSMTGAKRFAWIESKMASLRTRFLEKKKQAIDRLLVSYAESSKASLTRAPLQQLTEDRLTEEVRQAREMYQMFLRQKEGAEMVKAIKDAQSPFLYRLIDPPRRPMFSIAMARRTPLMIAVVLGLGMGLGLAIGLDQLDRSLKTIDAVELHLDTPVFGLMPKLHGKDFHFVLDSKEAVDVQRIASKLTRQLFRGIKQDRAGAIHRSKVIMITSSVMGEGKSTFSAYLSACFAEMLNSTSILLIDGDLRRGALHKIFKVDNSYGLGNLLEENEEYQPEVPCLQSTKHARLHVLTSGQSEESPVALFTSEKFSKMLEQLKKYYELIILDTPPVIPVNDAMILSRFADTILYVVKAGETPREIAQRGIGLVRTTESHLSGVVMNNMRSVLPYYYRHEYYKYQYEREPQDNSRQNGHDKNGAALKKHLAGDGGDGSEVKESDKSPEKLIAGDDENGIVSDNDKSSAGFIEGMQHAG